jgi:hypothetical protein
MPPVQLVTLGGALPFARHQSPAAGATIPVGDLQRIASQPSADPTGPALFAVRLIRLSPHRHVIMMQIHHIISDGWSIGVLYRELSELYNSFAAGRAPELAPLPRSFAQTCASLRGERRSARMTGQVRYWGEQLRGPWPVMPAWLSPQGTGHGVTPVDAERVDIPRDVVDGLRAAGRAAGHRGGLAGPVLAALAAVLYADGGSPDVRIGTMVANRASADVEHLIGYFVNIAVMRVRIAPGQTMGQLVADANSAVTAGLANQEAPIQDVTDHLKARAGLRDAPLYQVTLALNEMRPESLTLDGLDCADLDIDSLGPRLAPTSIEQRWFLESRAGGLSGTLTYRTETFDRRRIRATLQNLDRAMRDVLAPGRTVADAISKFEGTS